MSNVHAIRPAAPIRDKIRRAPTAYFAAPYDEPVENQVNVWHVQALVNSLVDVRFEFNTFCAILSATSIK